MIRLLVMGFSAGLFATAGLAGEATGDAYLEFLRAQGEPSWIAAGASHEMSNDVTRPIPSLDEFSIDPAKQSLGFALFHDARLSENGTVSCSSCHMGMHGGTDNLPVSVGINGSLGERNAPTIFNSAFNFRQFWDGRALNLEEQALGPIQNPIEMGHDLESVIEFISSDAAYAEAFENIYPDGVTEENLGNAIAQQGRMMTRSDSRFNDYLNGDAMALTPKELMGWQRFQEVGCTSCHNGINLGGNSYQGPSGNLERLTLSRTNKPDEGLFNRSQRETDRQVFKVPGLHNVALTAPYFHDGSVNSLPEAVAIMGREQSGRELADDDVENIVAFLESLSSGFFAGRGQGMSHDAMQGEMRRQMQMQHHQSGSTMPMQQHGSAEAGMGQSGQHSMMHQRHQGMGSDMHHRGDGR